MTEAFLGFGSNLGDKAASIREGEAALAADPRIRNFRMSSLYRTAPVGVKGQDWFVNSVARLETDLSPRELLERCLAAEQRLKRVRRERWGPRTLDVDVLWFGGMRIEEEELRVPHPRMLERAFVLAPLAELRPGLALDGRPVEAWLAEVGEQGVERIGA